MRLFRLVARRLGAGPGKAPAHGAIVLAAALCLAVPGGAVDLKPGLWEITGSVERDGRVWQRPAQSRCISVRAAEASREDIGFIMDLAGFARLKARLGAEACKIVESGNKPARLDWRFICKCDAIIEQKGILRADDPARFAMEVTTRMTTGDKWLSSTMRTEGRYMGECSK